MCSCVKNQSLHLLIVSVLSMPDILAHALLRRTASGVHSICCSQYCPPIREELFQREVRSMYEDKTLVCKECGNEFVFTAGEQEFYAERGFQNEPQRCKACRDARKNAARGPREFFTATCANCGGEAKVPFEPKTDRPVYCSDCFARMKG